MKLPLVLTLMAFAASPALAEDCTYPQREPVERDGQTQYRFTDSCGDAYEVGYRLEGNTLYMPGDAEHSLPEETEAAAETLLREAYGLVGERDSLIRTKW